MRPGLLLMAICTWPCRAPVPPWRPISASAMSSTWEMARPYWATWDDGAGPADDPLLCGAAPQASSVHAGPLLHPAEDSEQ